jgi:hypothetical protein
MMRLQATPAKPASMTAVRNAFRDLVLPESLLNTLGCAINSRSSVFLTGLPGTGKTAVAERMNAVITGTLWIPYAIEIDGQVIRVYDAQNHQAMSDLRAAKVASVAKFIPPQKVEIGPEKGALAVVGWGSTYGALYQAVRAMPAKERVSHIHIRYLSPLPENLAELLSGFDQILVPEMNMGQLATLLRDKLGVETIQFNKVTGQPFLIGELVQKIRTVLGAKPAVRAVRGERA